MITRSIVRACAQSATRKAAPQSVRQCLNASISIQSSYILRYHQLRAYSTPSPDTPPRPTDLRSQFSSSPPPPTQNISTQPTPKRSLRPYIYATLFLLLGLTSGQYVRLILAPPALPPAGSDADTAMIKYISQTAAKLPIVQSLSADRAWTSHDAYSTLTDAERSARLTSGPLAGARALGGYQRVFVNKETGEVVTVVYFGGVIAGWPGVTHGGVTATIMDECLGRCAIRQFEKKSGVTANLEIKYLKPVVTNAFYVVRATPDLEGKTERKCWVNGRLEGTDGRVCVQGRALFVVPKGYETKVLEREF